MATSEHPSERTQSIRFRCPHCGKKLVTSRAAAGRSAHCSGCQRRLAVPTPEDLPVARPAADLEWEPTPGSKNLGATTRPRTVPILAMIRRRVSVIELRGLQAELHRRLVALGLAALRRGANGLDVPGGRPALDELLDRIEEQRTLLEAMRGTGAAWVARRRLQAELAELDARRDAILVRIGRADLERGQAEPEAARTIASIRRRIEAVETEVEADTHGHADKPLAVADLLPKLPAIRPAPVFVSVALCALFGLAAPHVLNGLRAFFGPGAITSVHSAEVDEAVGLVAAGFRIVGPDGQRWEEPLSTGTAFVVTPEGHLLTNRHVIEEVWNLANAPHILETFRNQHLHDVTPTVWVFIDGKKYVAEVRHVSEEYDLAVLEIDRGTGPYFRLSQADDPGRGVPVFTLGYPGGSTTSIEDEEILRDLLRSERRFTDVARYFKERDFGYVEKSGTISRGFRTEGGTHWLEHNAEINSGNSGGPLVDASGLVVGINTLKLRDTSVDGTFFSFSPAQCREELERVISYLSWD